MRQLILLMGAALLVTSSFAATTNLSQSLALAWKQQATMHAKLDPQDITIVYGGADISRNPTAIKHISAA